MIADRRFWVGSSVILGAPLVLLIALLASPGWDRSWGSSSFHFWIVSSTSAAAALICAMFIALAGSLRESRTLFLALAFMSIAAIFSVHGLSTPGHIHDQVHPELQLSPWLSLLLGSFFAACSAVTLPEHAGEWFRKYASLAFGAVAFALGIYVSLSIAMPGWLAFIPANDRSLQLAATFISLGLLAFAGWRYFQAFMFARLVSQWATVLALALLMEVQASLTWGRFWHFSWWEYHFLYGVTFLVLFAGWAAEALRSGSLSVFAEGLTMRDAIAQLDRGQARPITDLIDAIEHKDVYTLGHVRRVARYAFLIGKELKLSSADLRNVSLAGQMHDVGKIGTPDRILTKPGPLTPQEFAIIKEHADRGYEIALQVEALRPVAEAIRHHHERLDGGGYPLGLSGESIPLLSRIVAVADAYDAMTSGRVYQPAISQEAAVEELRRCSGAHFDPACVEAFTAALAKQPAENLHLPLVQLRPLEGRAA